MRRLNDNLNNAYVEAANRLRPSRRRRRIVAYVESFDDIFFWRTVLDEFENESLYFEIQLPSRRSLQKGKKAALMNLLHTTQLGSSMIACVDADYDWILRDTTETSRFINSSPFVLHTRVYAIENFQCYAPSLHQAVVQATLNDRPTIEFESFLSQYSIIVWPLFVWNIWAYRADRYSGFTMTDFCGFVSFRDVNIHHPEQTLEQLRRRVNQKISWMQRKHPEAKNGPTSYSAVRDDLLSMGLTPETTYLFIQGHTLFENVVMPLLSPICNMLRREREREIQRLACHSTQRQNELSSYQHSQMPIELVLRRNIYFKDAPMYQQIRDNITKIINM
ncbi:MAG: DUF4435 domain-containing protein [Bacteroidaceae bacterium]|nr:DUF4435 domain-containing protein [Bacteroidaceae bacterium]